MMTYIQQSGPFFWPILGVLILIAVRAIGLARATGRAAEDPGLGARINGLLFWGGLAALLGLLGQCTGIYNGLRAISGATEISPKVVYAGLAESFYTTIFGLCVLLVAGLAWLVLTNRWRRRGRAVVLTLLAGLCLAGASDTAAGAVGDLCDGGWAAEAGPDRFVFVFESTDGTIDRGMSHSLREGRQYIQAPFTVERHDPPDLEFALAGTGVRYRGRVDLAAGRIRGGLVFPDGGGMDMDLAWLDPATEPGFPARAEAGPYAYAPPPALDDGWTTADAGDHGLAPEVIEGIVGAVCEGRAGLLHALLVIHDGALVVEEYFHGYDREALHPLASVTKSVAGLLVGLAVDRGKIDGLQTPLLDFFPFARTDDARWRSATLAHLLTMNLGLDWSDEEAESLHGTGPAFFERILARGFAAGPGAGFRYVNADVNLLSGVIEAATDKSPERFAEERLFAPLGIGTWRWDYMAEGPHRLMDGSLQLRPRDMARIGQMMLDEGRWNGRQVLSPDFARAAVSRRVDDGDQPDGRGGYGYLWWTMEIGPPDAPLEVAYANGWGSQYIFLVPDADLVVVTTGGNQDNGLHTAPQRVVGLPLLRGLGAI